MYKYGNSMIPSLDDKFLYHFTSAESLLKILENMTLRMSSFENLNDLNEKEVNFSFQDWSFGLKIEKYIVEHCKLLSFSKNFLTTDYFCECGCNHPRMWAQYSDRNKGACIVINEDMFINENKPILNEIFWKIENVNYKPYIYHDNPTEPTHPQTFIEDYYGKIFFEKHNDWRQEDERRLLCIGGPEYLSINNCIEFICLGNKFNSKNYSELIDILMSNIEKEFMNLTPHDFTFQLNDKGRCVVADNAFRIIDYINEKRNTAYKYLKFLNETGYDI